MCSFIYLLKELDSLLVDDCLSKLPYIEVGLPFLAFNWPLDVPLNSSPFDVPLDSWLWDEPLSNSPLDVPLWILPLLFCSWYVSFVNWVLEVPLDIWVWDVCLPFTAFFLVIGAFHSSYSPMSAEGMYIVNSEIKKENWSEGNTNIEGRC